MSIFDNRLSSVARPCINRFSFYRLVTCQQGSWMAMACYSVCHSGLMSVLGIGLLTHAGEIEPRKLKEKG